MWDIRDAPATHICKLPSVWKILDYVFNDLMKQEGTRLRNVVKKACKNESSEQGSKNTQKMQPKGHMLNWGGAGDADDMFSK